MELSSDQDLMKKITDKASAVNHNVLTDQEILQARHLLSSEENSIIGLDEQITQLVALRNAHKCSVKELKIALAPHKRIAPELLAMIFSNCLPHSSQFVPLNIKDVPWTLGQVCTLWRNVSRAESTIWSGIEVRAIDWGGNSYGADNLLRACELLPECAKIKLSISQSLQGYDELWSITPPDYFANVVCMEISPDDEMYGSEAEEEVEAARRLDNWKDAHPFALANNLREAIFVRRDFDPLMDLLIPIVPWHHLTTLRCRFLSELSEESIFSVLKNCSSLERFDVGCKDWISPTTSQSFPYMHCLRSFTIVCEQRCPVLWLWNDLWSRLSFLDLSGTRVDGDTLYKILKTGYNLQTLMYNDFKEPPEHTTVGELLLPHLRHLTIGTRHKWLFKSLLAPSLQTLKIISTLLVDYNDVCQLLRLSKCSISSLVLHHERPYLQRVYHPSIRDLLSLLPAARYVELEDIPLNDATLQDIGRSLLLPQVQDFRCAFPKEKQFLDMVDARAQLELFETGSVSLKYMSCVTRRGRNLHTTPAISRAQIEKLQETYGIECVLHADNDAKWVM